MVSLRHEEEEALLPTIISEKVPLMKEDLNEPSTVYLCEQRSSKMVLFKRLMAAIALMLMGASILRAFERYPGRHHMHHRHNYWSYHGQSSSVSHTLHGHNAHPSPFPDTHGPPGPPGHQGPHKPDFPFMHPPRPVECFALEEDNFVNFTLSVKYPGQPIFLDHSLNGARIALETEPLPAGQNVEQQQQQHHQGPPPPPPGKRPDHEHPGHGPHPGPGPHEGRPPCHGKPSTVLVSVNRLAEKKLFISPDADESKTKEDMFVCSLDLPFGQMGVGLFHEKPKVGKDEKHGKEPCRGRKASMEKSEEPTAPKPFAPVAVKISFPAGQPFTVTSQLPPPPPHHFRFPHHRGPSKAWNSLLRYLKLHHGNDEHHERNSTHTIRP